MSEAEQLIAKRRAISGRRCGSCSLCCYVLEIDDRKLKKDSNVWCRYCQPGRGGCAIYQDRPTHRRGFACEWLINQNFGDHWFPHRAKMVCHLKRDETVGVLCLCINVDKRCPKRWREQPYLSEISAIALDGLERQSEPFYTYVYAGNDKFLILGERIIENPGYGIIAPVGPHKFEFIKTHSQEDTIRLGNAMTGMLQQIRAMPETERQRLAAELFARLPPIRRDGGPAKGL